MRRFAYLSALMGAVGLALIAGKATAYDVVLNDYGYPKVLASGLDQPRLTAVMTDGGDVIRYEGQPVVLNAFIDTGASGTVISNLNAVGYTWLNFWGEEEHVPSLGLDGMPAGEFIGQFTEIGIGGGETGDVTRPFGLRVMNGTIGAVTGENFDDHSDLFIDRGELNFWVRRGPGAAEIVNVLGMVLVDPVNVIGMPLINQGVMVMDPTPMIDEELIETHILPPGDPLIPADTDFTFAMRMQDYVGTAEPGEVLPTSADNPMVQGVSVSHTNPYTSEGVTLSDQEWLFDTGSSSTFLGLQQAWALGLVPDGMPLEEFAPLHAAAGGIVLPVGGIGGTIDVPIVELEEIRIPATNSNDVVVWRNVDVFVLDIAGLPGVFGMNLLLMSATIDPDDPLGSLATISPGYFNMIVFDPLAGELRLRADFELPPLTGDLNGDGFVGQTDLEIVLAEWGNSGAGIDPRADPTADLFVGQDDLDIVLADWGRGIPPAAPVPEPSTLAIFAFCGFALLRRRPKSR